MDEESKALRGCVSCMKSHSLGGVKQALTPGLAAWTSVLSGLQVEASVNPGGAVFFYIKLSNVKSGTNGHEKRVCRKTDNTWPNLETVKLTFRSPRQPRLLLDFRAQDGTQRCCELCNGTRTILKVNKPKIKHIWELGLCNVSKALGCNVQGENTALEERPPGHMNRE